jgi:hypothetical protein
MDSSKTLDGGETFNDTATINLMRIFHCDACGELVYFENTSCLTCGTALAYLPDVAEVRALNPTNEERWQSTAGTHYRLCQNYSVHNVCNRAVPFDESTPSVFPAA